MTSGGSTQRVLEYPLLRVNAPVKSYKVFNRFSEHLWRDC
jgi:hypothetical protein